MGKDVIVALIGNPNSGKTSLFNALTGLNHKVGNFPGVTVDKKTGTFTSEDKEKFSIIDLPGTYSLYPKSKDEVVTYDTVFSENNPVDCIVVVVDAYNLRRGLFLTTQILDLQIPTVIALTMNDTLEKEGKSINPQTLSEHLGAPVVLINPRNDKGIDNLKNEINKTVRHKTKPRKNFFQIPKQNFIPVDYFSKNVSSPYLLWHQYLRISRDKNKSDNKKEIIKLQSDEVISRYKDIDAFLDNNNQLLYVKSKKEAKKILTSSIDNVLLHPIFGVVIMLVVLFFVFQSIFWLASVPMDWIDLGMSNFGTWVETMLPESWWRSLLVDGIIAGIGGIVIFVPQIAILFFLITILEDSGYMARISFLLDRLFQASGLSGKSVMPVMSGMACAIPAVMAARTIEDRKQRVITALVTPFMSCSARLPVYTILISLIIPKKLLLGFISYQGLVLMGLYFLGFFMTLVVAKILSWALYKSDKSYFVMELPIYQIPRWKNAFISMIDKARIFVFEAGKIIIIISIILWVLTSFGPPSRMENIESKYQTLQNENGELSEQDAVNMGSEKLENSYAGIIGKSIEPVIAPLGYDWKIGIALITSFAAREVFVGTMATLYTAEENEADGNRTLRQKMSSAKRIDGTPVYTLATGISLLLFYAFAMQCMSTIAIVKRELGGWKLAIFQLILMTTIAYFAALISYQLLK